MGPSSCDTAQIGANIDIRLPVEAVITIEIQHGSLKLHLERLQDNVLIVNVQAQRGGGQMRPSGTRPERAERSSMRQGLQGIEGAKRHVPQIKVRFSHQVGAHFLACQPSRGEIAGSRYAPLNLSQGWRKVPCNVGEVGVEEIKFSGDARRGLFEVDPRRPTANASPLRGRWHSPPWPRDRRW